MKKRFIAPTAIALAVAAGVGGGAVPGIASAASASGDTLTVWLMTGDTDPAVYNTVNAAFDKEYPGWTVNVEIQQWSGISTKVITSLASSTPPDVMELGNTDVAEFAASGRAGQPGLGQEPVPEQLHLAERPRRARPSTTAASTPYPSSPATASSCTTRRCSRRPGSPHARRPQRPAR